MWGKRLLRWGSVAGVVMVAFVFAANIWIIGSTHHQVITNVDDLPAQHVALVLGTSHRLANGSPNPFFYNRIEAAASLYAQGKITHVLVSGDNRTQYYNEPVEMKKALVREGVPDSAITLDFAGLRTLDSIVRSKEVFGQHKLVIITQPFHSYRALFISQYYQIDAVALVAEEPRNHPALQVHWREYLARTKAVLDLYVLKTGPRHIGQREPIRI
ncbi:MAG: vancomycin high temperature exclusion protein [Cyclobacteriaceae bacterium]|nr:YdcF family protein [Flammeovirgaceae bacterium]